MIENSDLFSEHRSQTFERGGDLLLVFVCESKDFPKRFGGFILIGEFLTVSLGFLSQFQNDGVCLVSCFLGFFILCLSRRY